MSMFSTAMFLETTENLCRNIHDKMKRQGFWDEGVQTIRGECSTTGGDREYQVKTRPTNLAEKLALVHSEISEALEALRNPHPDYEINETQWWSEDGNTSLDKKRGDNYIHPEGFGIELADAVIRIMDVCGHLGIDLGRCILDKMEYNDSRIRKHGKQF